MPEIPDWLDRALSSRLAWLLPLVAALVVLLTSGAFDAGAWSSPGTFRFGAQLALPLIAALFALLLVWSWRRLVKPRAALAELSAADRVVYGYGVRRFGFAFGLAMAAFQAVTGIGRLLERASMSIALLPSIVLFLVLALVVAMPLGLWAGYVWGRAIGRLSGGAPPRR